MTTRSLGSLLRDSPRRLASLLDRLRVASTSGPPPESPTTRISCSRIYQRAFSTVVRAEGGDFRSDYDVCVVAAGAAVFGIGVGGGKHGEVLGGAAQPRATGAGAEHFGLRLAMFGLLLYAYGLAFLAGSFVDWGAP